MENRPDYPALRVGDLQVVGEVGKPVSEDSHYMPAGYDTYINVRGTAVLAHFFSIQTTSKQAAHADPAAIYSHGLVD